MNMLKLHPIAPLVECTIWGDCIHGAGCELSTFQREDRKKMPPVVMMDGIPHCYLFKKG